MLPPYYPGNPEYKGFYCAKDVMALAVVEAAIAAGKKDQIIVVGMTSSKMRKLPSRKVCWTAGGILTVCVGRIVRADGRHESAG
jgi:hypothetical protein